GSTAGGEVALIVGERFRDRGRPVASLAALAAGELAGLVLRLPPRKDVLTVGVFVVVGLANVLEPGATVAVGDAHDPTAGALAAAMAEREPGSDGREVKRLAADGKLEAGGAAFEPVRARAASHGGVSLDMSQ